MKIQSIKQNITLENVKKSNYWDLLAIIIWNHYSEKKFQNEKNIKIYESWYGKSEDNVSSSYSTKWDNPEYSEKDYIRTLKAIVIEHDRSDYTSYIYIHTDGNINCFGIYKDKTKEKDPTYHTSQRNIDKTNWLLENKFVQVL